MNNIVVLVSGDGSNLQAIINACLNNEIDGQVSAVISNTPNAYALQRAVLANIPAHFLNPKDCQNRQSYDLALIEIIEKYSPKLIVLAGYMRILTPDFVQQYQGRLINIHPSLLPKYPGLHTHQQVIDNRDTEHGSSVHFVTEQLDGGPVILQEKFSVNASDTIDSLNQRIKQLEHRIYPTVINCFMQNRLAMRNNQTWLDGVCLPKQGYNKALD